MLQYSTSDNKKGIALYFNTAEDTTCALIRFFKKELNDITRPLRFHVLVVSVGRSAAVALLALVLTASTSHLSLDAGFQALFYSPTAC